MRRLRQVLGLPAACVGFAVVIGAATAAAPPTLYVDHGHARCSDSGPGTAARPFCTIGAAAARVKPGQTVRVEAGTYTETVSVSRSGRAGAPITFAPAPRARVILRSSRNGFALTGVEWIRVVGFNVTQTRDYGISITNSSHITLTGNHVSYAGRPSEGMTKYGIRLQNSTDSVVAGNTVDHNSNSGIALVSGSARIEVKRNDVFANARGFERGAAGIRLFAAPDNTIEGNITHDNEDSGIEIYPGSNNVFVYKNVAYNNGDHGIDDSFAPNARILGNIVYNNDTAGINVEGDSTGATIASNIVVDNGIASPRTHSNIRVEAGSTLNTTMDYNLVYLTQPDTLLIWNSVGYKSLSQFQAATGQEMHGIQADPRFANPADGDFHLLAGSPAFDSLSFAASG
jgi:parallel beta-helix repeat protein